jgi:hypothetical protein
MYQSLPQHMTPVQYVASPMTLEVSVKYVIVTTYILVAEHIDKHVKQKTYRRSCDC